MPPEPASRDWLEKVVLGFIIVTGAILCGSLAQSFVLGFRLP